MNRDVIKEQLLSLTEIEAKILYWICQGWTYEDISHSDETKIHYSVPAITLFMSSVYEKIGLDDPKIHHSQRRKILKEVYCPELSKVMKGNDEFQPNDTEPPKIKPDTYALAVVDNHELVKAGEKRLTIWEKKQRGIVTIGGNGDDRNDRRIKWWHLLLIATGFIIGALIVKTYFPTTLIERIIETSIVKEEVLATVIQTQIAYIEVTSTPPPITDTPQPTNTPAPTNTPVPTRTPTISPYIFNDNFDLGLLPEWDIFLGEPSFVNGKITTSGDLIMFTGDETWTDYSVTFDGHCSRGERYGGEGCLIAVRVLDTDNYIAYEFYDYEGWWITVTNGVQEKISGSGYRSVYGNPEHCRITVEGNVFKTYINGNLNSTVINTDYLSGGIGLKLISGTQLDNFEVKRLP